MFLHHKNPRILSFPTGYTAGQVTGELHLIPGINKVDAEVVAAMKKHPTLAPMFESGELEVITDSKGQDVTQLGGVDEKQAEKIVAECNDPELLRSFLDVEKRTKVKRVLEKKIKELENPTDKESE